MERSIVVCGGSKGIGAATVKLLLKKDFRVYCVSRSIGELESIRNDNLIHLECDLRNSDSRKSALNKIIVDSSVVGLVNNASGPTTGQMTDTTHSDYLEAFECHLFASNDFVQALVPNMKRKGLGKIVNIISVTAKVPLENMGVSNTLRGALLNWSKTLSRELGKFNINVNNVLPGYTETDRLIEVVDSASQKLNISNEEYCQKLISQIPIGRFGRHCFSGFFLIV
jgi:3-oxoacyl-[acyl-carrier protein] reductase